VRLKLEFLLTKNEFPIEYRKCFISYLKNSLSKIKEFDYLNKYYSKNEKKDFSFAIKIPIEKIEKQKILLKENKATMIFSTGDNLTGHVFYNAFISQKNVPFLITDHNFLILTSISNCEEKEIHQNSIVVKTESPLCILDHTTDRNWYNTYEECDFANLVEMKTGLQITPIECKKVVIKHYDIFIPCSTGLFLLSGQQNKLMDVCRNGMGDKKSQGFGLLTNI